MKHKSFYSRILAGVLIALSATLRSEDNEPSLVERFLALFSALSVQKDTEAVVSESADAQPKSTPAPSLVNLFSATDIKEVIQFLIKEETRHKEIAAKLRLDEEHERNKWFNAQTQFNAEAGGSFLSLHHGVLRKFEEEQQQFFKYLLDKHHAKLDEHEQKRREAIRKKEEMRQKAVTEKEKIRQDTELKLGRIEQENLDKKLKHDTETRQLSHNNAMEKLSAMGAGIMVFTGDKKRMMETAAALSALALGVYAAKRGSKVAADYVSARLMRPTLVTATSRLSLNELCSPFYWFKNGQKKASPAYHFNDDMQEKVKEYINAIEMGKNDGQPFRHALFYGPPGTGKTLLAKEVAEKLGLDYAIISGANIHQFGDGAVQELNRLFAWAKASKKGMVLFWDEVDAMLLNRMGRIRLSPLDYKIQSTFYALTGTETKKFLIIGATNVPELLDPAFLSRMDERIAFSVPNTTTRIALLKQYFDLYIKDARSVSLSSAVDEMYLQIAQATEGFTGRDISQLGRACAAAGYNTDNKVVTPELVQRVVVQRIEQKEHIECLTRERK